jgi:hypothetical protein
MRPPFVRASLGKALEPTAKSLNVRAATGVELAAEADVETSSPDDVGHEGVARDEAAAGQSDREGTHVETITRAAPSLREIAFEDSVEMPFAVTLDRTALTRQCHAGGEFA